MCRVSYDLWDGINCDEIECWVSDIQLFVEILDKMDGKKTTIVTVSRRDASLTLGGGNDGRYLAYADREDSFLNMVDSSRPEEPLVDIVAGGQEAQYPFNRSFTLNEVKVACETFFITGNLSDSFDWLENE